MLEHHALMNLVVCERSRIDTGKMMLVPALCLTSELTRDAAYGYDALSGIDSLSLYNLEKRFADCKTEDEEGYRPGRRQKHGSRGGRTLDLGVPNNISY